MASEERSDVHNRWSTWLLPTIVSLVFGFTTAADAEPIQGAGSTFAAPIIQEWSRDYEAARADGGDFVSPDWKVDYEPIGSLAGIMRLDQPELDFAATDVPLSSSELEKTGREQFPIIMGGIAVVANFDRMEGGALRISGAVLADIYLGKIRRWSDPQIQALNPELVLPDIDIVVIHRQDGSGSTYALSQFLSASSTDWKQQVGSDTLLDWPTGVGAEGTAALLDAVRQTKGAIGYADYGQARRVGLSVAALQNKAGDFVTPDPSRIEAAIPSMDWGGRSGFAMDLSNSTEPSAYPLAIVTYAVVPLSNRPDARRRRVHDLFRLGFTQGADDARALGYVPLPSALTAAIEASWATTPVASR